MAACPDLVSLRSLTYHLPSDSLPARFARSLPTALFISRAHAFAPALNKSMSYNTACYKRNTCYVTQNGTA
eukprot:6193053-Pleurochrysis_carterae.AAC.6